MGRTFEIAQIKGISIKLHWSFFLLILFFGKWFFFVAAVFFFVTMHELAHSFVARKFGIDVRDITLYPIGGIASMSKLPQKPYQEFLISIAGPLSNLAFIVIFFFPMKAYLGSKMLYASLKYVVAGYFVPYNFEFVVGQIYWINLLLALFNLLPAFPMDGGRVFRAILATKLGFYKATKIAVNFGHFFALIFGYIGFSKGRFLLLVIAIFIFISASEELFVAKMMEKAKNSQ